MSCQKCGRYKVVKRGRYKVKKSIFPSQRFYCKKCNYTFTERNKNFKFVKYPLWIRKKIIKLYKKKKGYINKYDSLKKKTYSTREIAKRLNVSYSFVHRLTKNEKS